MWIKIVLVLHVLAIFVMAALAGSFLSGDDASVQIHQVTGWIVLLICLIQLVVAVRTTTLAFIMATAAIFLCEGLQIGTGYGRFLGVHIPLSVIIAGIVTGQLVWAFRRPVRQKEAA